MAEKSAALFVTEVERLQARLAKAEVLCRAFVYYAQTGDAHIHSNELMNLIEDWARTAYPGVLLSEVGEPCADVVCKGNETLVHVATHRDTDDAL